MLVPRCSFALRRGAALLRMPQVQVPLTLSRPAAGASHGFGRCASVSPAGQHTLTRVRFVCPRVPDSLEVSPLIHKQSLLRTQARA